MACRLDWTNAGILLIRPLGTNFSEILIGNQIFSFTKMYLKMSSTKWRPFYLGLNVLNREWRCSWSSADRRCSNYFWMIKNFIAYKGAPYIIDFTVTTTKHNKTWLNRIHISYSTWGGSTLTHTSYNIVFLSFLMFCRWTPSPWHRVDMWSATLIVGVKRMVIYGIFQGSVQRYCSLPTYRKAVT